MEPELRRLDDMWTARWVGLATISEQHDLRIANLDIQVTALERLVSAQGSLISGLTESVERLTAAVQDLHDIAKELARASGAIVDWNGRR